MANEKLYLIAHTNDAGTNAAQAQISATSETEAREKFRALYPLRVITTTGTAVL